MPAPIFPGDLVRIRDERWIVTRQSSSGSIAVLDVRGDDRTNAGVGASFLLPFDIVERLPSSGTLRRVRPRQWRRLVKPILANATPSWQSLRAPLHARISLLPFQLEPALAVTRGMASRLLIADDVGLGKTIQAGLVIAEAVARTPTARVLVVTPASLREQWRSELRERFHLDPWIADTASLASAGYPSAWAGNPWSAHAVTITSIDFVKRPEVMRPLESLVWDVVVLDEAHGLAGSSDRGRAAQVIARRSRVVVMLTATPHNGDDGAFEELCGTGDIGHQFPLLTFRRTRQDAGLDLPRRTTTLRVRPSLAEREMHRTLRTYIDEVQRRCHPERRPAAHLAMSVLTRRACSSASSLARSIERRLTLLGSELAVGVRQLTLPIFETADDEEPGAELAAQGLDDLDEERRHLTRLLRLAERSAPTESKPRVIQRLLRRVNEPAIVFTEYRDTLTRLAGELNEFAPAQLHGGLTAMERRDVIRRFTTGGTRLLLATDAASEGLNLQHRCRLVVNLELPWTPLRLEQRIGRVHRIGQTRRVHAVHLVAMGTADESARGRLERRSDRASAALHEIRASADESRARNPDDLQSAAQDEATRIANARRLAASAPQTTVHGRPPAILLRRRSARGILAAFRVRFTSADHRPVWETVVGAWGHPSGGNTGAAWAALELAIEALDGAMDAEVAHAHRSLTTALAAVIASSEARGNAITATIRNERARLAADLLQPGLFDRRSERLLAAQRAVLDEALARCEAHAVHLVRLRQIVVDRRCAFAMVRK